MTPRGLINLIKTPLGAFLAFCAILGIAIFIFERFTPAKGKSQPLSFPSKAAAAEGQTEQSFQNANFSRVDSSPPTNSNSQTPRHGTNAPVRAEVLPISLFAENPQTEPKQLSKHYAPYGRLIPCELIVTVDSSSIRTPIVGLVTEDIYHAGRLIIPAGTEVHGTAQTDHNRERIASGNRWTLVWQTGEELNLSGIALDREADQNGEGWGITDGSAGLRGRIIKSDDMAEIKLFAATFLSGAAGLFSDRENTIFGSQTSPTLGNAPLVGAQSVLQTYAQQIYDSIQRDGFYVRVPAGKQFYLYVTQTIDESDAVIGGTRLSETAPDGQTNLASSINGPIANRKEIAP